MKIDNGNRSWGVGNSGNPYYSLIDCSAPGAPQGNQANSTIKFNLGVDYTLGWTGDVILNVIHCDGDICTLTYHDWCAKPAMDCITDSPLTVDTLSMVDKKMLAGGITFTKGKAAFVTLEMDSSRIDDAKLISASLWFEDESGNFIGSAKSSLTGSKNEKNIITASNTLMELDEINDEKAICKGVAIYETKEIDKPVKFIVTLYDKNSYPIGIEQFSAESPIGAVEFNSIDDIKIQIVPNPTDGKFKIYFFNTTPGNAEIAITDILGNKVHKVITDWLDQNLCEQTLDLSYLSSGSYVVSLKLPNGNVISKTIFLVR